MGNRMGAWRGQMGAACQSISSPAALRSEHSSAPSALIVADRVPFDSVCRSIIAKLPNSLRDRGVDRGGVHVTTLSNHSLGRG
jgi:hypothetical protein